jgi:hypothetical protein
MLFEDSPSASKREALGSPTVCVPPGDGWGETSGTNREGAPGEEAGKEAAAGLAVAAGLPRLPTGRISSFSRSFPRVIHALSRSTEARYAPGSISSFTRNAFGSFIPFAQRTARLADGVEDTIVPTRTKLLRGAWEADFPSIAGSLDASRIPSRGAKRLFHSVGGIAGLPGTAGDATVCAVPFGEYASRLR